MMAKPLEVEEKKFDELVLKSNLPVLVDFWAPWCGPCRMIAPIIDELAGEYEGKISFYKVNVDNNPRLAQRYGVMSIPTLIIFKGGQPLSNLVGFRPKNELKKSLDQALSA
ncbi:MAG: thioredoxin [Dehalococcoidales bacterium]|nr:thioredoxin [Dehalococcoidales bacterium]